MAELTMMQSIWKLKCPHCRQGDLFYKPGFFVVNGLSAMPEHCPHCNLKYDQEPGFFWGAMYISYGLAVAIALPTFIIIYVTTGITFLQAIAVITFIMLLTVPFIFRLSRSIWIHLFVSYRPQ